MTGEGKDPSWLFRHEWRSACARHPTFRCDEEFPEKSSNALAPAPSARGGASVGTVA